MPLGRDWSETEAGIASQLHRAGNKPRAIATALPHRSADAIKAKLNRMGEFTWRVAPDPFVLDLRGKLRSGRRAVATPC